MHVGIGIQSPWAVEVVVQGDSKLRQSRWRGCSEIWQPTLSNSLVRYRLPSHLPQNRCTHTSSLWKQRSQRWRFQTLPFSMTAQGGGSWQGGGGEIVQRLLTPLRIRLICFLINTWWLPRITHFRHFRHSCSDTLPTRRRASKGKMRCWSS